MKLRISTEAQEQYAFIDAWWRRNRDKAPDLFAVEVAKALELLPDAPKIGELRDSTPQGELRRVVLMKTHHVLYYRIHVEADVLEVVTIWGAPRREPPPL